MPDVLLLDETASEEAASWLEAAELGQDLAVWSVRRAEAVARGYVLAARAGRADLAVADVMGSLALDRRSAEAVLAEALLLVAHPATVQAVDARRLGWAHVRALLGVLAGLDDALADQVEDAVLQDVVTTGGRSPARVRELARRHLLRLDPDGAAERRRTATAARALTVRDAGDGMVTVTLLARAEVELAILHRAERETAQDDGSGRTRDQRRADWAAETLLRDPGSADGPTQGADLVLDGRRRRPVQVLVHVPVVTALGLADAPCELAEIGPVDADHGRLLLSTAELRKVCVDAASGRVVHVEDRVVRPVADEAEVRRRGGGAAARAAVHAEAVQQALRDMVLTPSVAPVEPEDGYRPSAALSRTVKTRHPRCDFLTCACPSRHCDDEHTRPWPRGQTSEENLRPRSRWCHRARQRGWTPADLPDGTTLWTSPSGRQYPAPPQHAPPPGLLPGRRGAARADRGGVWLEGDAPVERPGGDSAPPDPRLPEAPPF